MKQIHGRNSTSLRSMRTSRSAEFSKGNLLVEVKSAEDLRFEKAQEEQNRICVQRARDLENSIVPESVDLERWNKLQERRNRGRQKPTISLLSF